jgi:hypothetical protein
MMLMFIVASMAACVTPQKMNKHVSRHYGEMPAIKMPAQTLPIAVETKLTDGSSNMEMSTGKRYWKKFLPLIVYNKEHMVVETNLNYKIPVNQFTNSLYQYARTQKVTDKLAGKNLTVTIDQLPRTFSFNNKTTNILLLFNITKVYLEPNQEDVKVTYALHEGGKMVKIGMVQVQDPNKAYGIQYFQSLKAATDDYLNAYDNFYKNLGRTVLDRIMAELN